MATQAQQLANAANAQFSTGPRTGAGKAASSRNARTHGLSTGVLTVSAEQRPEFDAFSAALVSEMKPAGALEMDALLEFRDAAWRLRQVRAYVCRLAAGGGADPLTHPETAAVMRQLHRFRAAAEMSLHRSLDAFRDLQTLRFARVLHVAKSENEAIGPLAAPAAYALMRVEGIPMNRLLRDRFDANHGIVAVT